MNPALAPLPVVERIRWSTDFLVLEATLRWDRAMRILEEATERWVVIRRDDGLYLYAFEVPEVFESRALPETMSQVADPSTLTLEEALDLHEEQQSTKAPDRSQPPPIDKSWRAGWDAPSIDRYVEAGADNVPRAVGVRMSEKSVRRGTRSAPPPPPPLGAEPPAPPPAPPSPSPAFPPTDAVDAQMGVTPTGTGAIDDEGTSPIRYPSIEPAAALAPGALVTLTVDLLRERDDRTQGGAVAPGPLPQDWSTLELTVALSCAGITFQSEGRGTITIRRNTDSIPATIEGTVSSSVAPGTDVVVMAEFYHGTRYCGGARRELPVGAAAATAPTTPAAAPTAGRVSPEPQAAQPDLTVHIFALDPGRPGLLTWQVVVSERFDGLPAMLHETIDLGTDPEAQAGALFKRFATLERGKHRSRIEGFGSELWGRAPRMFRNAYWALWDHYRRPLRIQFISDDPHLPWELMRPARADESEVHAPIALMHPVARWIKQWDGYMRNAIPDGRICTIAPKYPSVSRTLPRAQTEAKLLEDTFRARRVDGTREAVESLLEARSLSEPVAIVHFAGHGTFSADAATEAAIKLEDGDLTASEVSRPEVKLGATSRTLVFFNACQVGATGAVFGQVGGWANALLGRRFGGFIAPLWSVDDEDASVVARELLDGVMERHEPIGDVLRAIREKHGGISPTFYSYLYYGDVTAHVGG